MFKRALIGRLTRPRVFRPWEMLPEAPQTGAKGSNRTQKGKVGNDARSFLAQSLDPNAQNAGMAVVENKYGTR